MASTARTARGPSPTGAWSVLRTLIARPNRRAALRRGAALLLAIAVMSVAASTHRRGLELSERWGETAPVLVLDETVSAGEPLDGRVRAVAAPSALVPDAHLEVLPPGARAATDLVRGEILTTPRLHDDGVPDHGGPGHQRALVPVPLHGRDGGAPSELAPGDVVDVIGPGAPTAAGGRDPARTVAAGTLVRSLDADSVTLEVAAVDVPGLADALLGGPVVLIVVGGDRTSGPGRGDVVDDE